MKWIEKPKAPKQNLSALFSKSNINDQPIRHESSEPPEPLSGYAAPYKYEGNKTGLLTHLHARFPTDCTDTIIDLFGGTGIVSGYSEYENIIYCEADTRICGIYAMFTRNDGEIIANSVEKLTKHFNPMTEQGYIKLRSNCNMLMKGMSGMIDTESAISLLALSFYSYGNRLRFNNSGEANISWGQGNNRYKDSDRKNIVEWADTLKRKKISVLCSDYKDVLGRLLANKGNDDKFVFCDPPYTVATATYNERQAGWDINNDFELFGYLSRMESKGIRYMMTNLTKWKGKTNKPLLKLAENPDNIAEYIRVKDRNEIVIRNYYCKVDG